MPASAVLYDTIIEKRITLPPSPELAQHAAGAVAKHSRRGWRVDKPANSRVQIDGLIALAMALDRHVTQRRPPSGSGSSRCRRPCIGCGRLIPGGSRCPRCRVARPRAPTASHPQHLRDRPLVRALRRTGRAPRPRRAAQPRRQGRHVELAGTLREVQPRQGRPVSRYYTLHSLRHYYATTLHRAGVPLKTAEADFRPLGRQQGVARRLHALALERPRSGGADARDVPRHGRRRPLNCRADCRTESSPARKARSSGAFSFQAIRAQPLSRTCQPRPDLTTCPCSASVGMTR
jgi:hypothetical protein